MKGRTEMDDLAGTASRGLGLTGQTPLERRTVGGGRLIGVDFYMSSQHEQLKTTSNHVQYHLRA